MKNIYNSIHSIKPTIIGFEDHLNLLQVFDGNYFYASGYQIREDEIGDICAIFSNGWKTRRSTHFGRLIDSKPSLLNKRNISSRKSRDFLIERIPDMEITINDDIDLRKGFRAIQYLRSDMYTLYG